VRMEGPRQQGSLVQMLTHHWFFLGWLG
jgi:hypothetical protein